MFIKNAWYVAAWADEVTDKPLARRILDQPVVLFRDAPDARAALADMCCHRGAPLSCGKRRRGRASSAAITAWSTTAAARACTFRGKCTSRPKRACAAYPVVEKDTLRVDLDGRSGRRRSSAIVDYPYHNDTRTLAAQARDVSDRAAARI